MITTPIVPPEEKMNARTYRRAHAGKLMIIHRAEGKEPAAADFFHIESVGTHPTGLMVTGRFENARLSHMMESAVREANTSEIQWLRSGQNQDHVSEPPVTPLGARLTP